MFQDKLGPKGISNQKDEMKPLEQHYLIEHSTTIKMFVCTMYDVAPSLLWLLNT